MGCVWRKPRKIGILRELEGVIKSEANQLLWDEIKRNRNSVLITNKVFNEYILHASITKNLCEKD